VQQPLAAATPLAFRRAKRGVMQKALAAPTQIQQPPRSQRRSRP
jgi:hypothetical protein